jgi:hypothetical protein
MLMSMDGVVVSLRAGWMAYAAGLRGILPVHTAICQLMLAVDSIAEERKGCIPTIVQ